MGIPEAMHGGSGCLLAVWLALVLVGGADGVGIGQEQVSRVLDDGDHDVQSLTEEADGNTWLETGETGTEADRKIINAPLPCCLQDPVPKGCKCFLVKATPGAVSAAKEKTKEAKEKAGSAKKTAAGASSKEKHLKRLAKNLSKSGSASRTAKKADRKLKRASKLAKKAMRKASRAARKTARAE